MTVIDIGDRAEVESLRGDPVTGEVVSRRIRVDAATRSPTEFVTVQVTDNVALERPQSAVNPR